MDLEMQRPPQEIEEERGRKALQILFGYTAEQLRQIPSASAWCRYMESCFLPLLHDNYSFIWEAIGVPRPETTFGCWAWFESVADSILRQKDTGTTIEDIWESLIRSSSEMETSARPSESEKPACLIAIFAVLCWCSMALQPKLVWTDPAAPPCLAVQQLPCDHQGLKMDFVQRPITAVFRNFQRSMNRNRWRTVIGTTTAASDKSTDLYVSTLNYDSLRTIGKVRLKWVDSMSNHLELDTRNRTLSIFRFPSFCALVALGEDNRGIVIEE
jgi:hypothetical protein